MQIRPFFNRPTCISARTWSERDRIANDFRSNVPLGGFVVIEEFLSPDFFSSIQDFALSAEMQRYCVFSRTQDASLIEKGFREPDEQYYYLSIHKRMRRLHGLPGDVEDIIASPEMLEFLSAISNVKLSGHEIPGTLTGWDPGDFLGEHTDEGDSRRPTKLVVSLSLTNAWKPEFGGMTHYRWLGQDSEILVQPTANTATIFQPGEHSVHWVTPIKPEAPRNQRYTWTLDYY